MKTVYWIGQAPKAKLAIVPCPRGDDRLGPTLLALRGEGVDVLVSLLTRPEEVYMGLEEERETAERVGMEYRSYPIPDSSTPKDMEAFIGFIEGLVEEIAEGKKVAAHCLGSIGRAPLTAAAILIEQGWRAEDALQAIELARGVPVPETKEQRRWIEEYAAFRAAARGRRER